MVDIDYPLANAAYRVSEYRKTGVTYTFNRAG
jgi:hypothetical protein